MPNGVSACETYNTFSISTRRKKDIQHRTTIRGAPAKLGNIELYIFNRPCLCWQWDRPQTLKCVLFRSTELLFPYILFDTALSINFISHPRMMTWLGENWRLYYIRCEIRSEINGIGNVASYWVSSWDSWLLLSYLSWILRGFFGC